MNATQTALSSNAAIEPHTAVNVLSVLDGIISMGHVPGESEQKDRDLVAVRAAIAKLIEAATMTANFDGLLTSNLRAMPFADQAMSNFRAALAAVGGRA